MTFYKEMVRGRPKEHRPKVEDTKGTEAFSIRLLLLTHSQEPEPYKFSLEIIDRK